ncbi:MAG: hypothetical protein IPK85_13415 [Gemmatimonadetes bacterium]|nr:hypothetical protein [Gemmatimonadota bacterium]
MTTCPAVEVAPPPRCHLKTFHVDGAHAPIDAIEIVHTARNSPPYFFATRTISVVEYARRARTRDTGAGSTLPAA